MLNSKERKNLCFLTMASLHFISITILLSLSLLKASAIGELQALMELKASLDPTGHVLDTWQSNNDPCKGDFEGVACNKFGKVINISLQGKGLRGEISPVVSELKSLNGLYLHFNGLKGFIPREIGDLIDLADLYLNSNNFSGNLPVEIGNLGNLQVLQLGYNQLNGSIPNEMGLLKNLSVLALQSNQITGAVPASLGDLTQLTRLDLSSNRLFGSIPSKLAQITSLTVLDLTSNFLSGNVPFGLKRLNGGFMYYNNTGLCGVGFKTLEACPSDNPLKPNKPEPVNKPQQIPQSTIPNNYLVTKPESSNNKHSSSSSAIIGSFVAISCVAICGFFAFLHFRRKKQKIGSSIDVSDSRLSTDQSIHLYRKSVSQSSDKWDPACQDFSQSLRFNLEEVECATQYFSEVNLLSKVNTGKSKSTYKGILRDGTIVVVKSINKTNCKTEEADFLKGLKIVTGLRHENLVRLRGFCCSRGRGECFLVYDFIANGCLSDYLDLKGENVKGRFLDWGTRFSIVKGIAKGIEYLHSNKTNKPGLLHQNISAEKILLDRNFTPRLSNAGLHKLLADDIVFSHLKSSAAMGYLAPEYTTTGRFTEKVDVYAFGILTFQIITGKMKVPHRKLSSEFGALENIIDENLNDDFNRLEAAKLVGLGLLCISDSPAHRPTMETVVQQLG